MGLAKTNLAILGLQWGDEGKGKVVDLLSPKFKQVVRFQGGNNAGHTVVVDGVSIALHQVPSGALHPGCFLVVGNGVVLNLEVFQQELDRLSARGFDLSGRLLMSEKAHVILPHHIALDQWRELRADKVGAKIGTTGRGIGPAYEMKAARMGIRLGDLLHPETLAERIQPGYEEVRIRLGADAGLPSLEAVIEGLLRIAEPFLPFIGDAQGHLQAAWERGESILFEGARPPCSTSTMAPTPSSPPAAAAWGACSPAPACRPRPWTRSWASPRPTPPASAPGPSPPSCSTPPASVCGRWAASSAPPPAGPAAAAGSTPPSPPMPAGPTAWTGWPS